MWPWPMESYDSGGCGAGVCCGLLLGTGFGKEGYLLLIRATYKRLGRDETNLFHFTNWREERQGRI